MAGTSAAPTYQIGEYQRDKDEPADKHEIRTATIDQLLGAVGE